MIGFEDMAQVHMAPVHSVRVALTHMGENGSVIPRPKGSVSLAYAFVY
jgi:hypothetical protein